MRSAQDDVPSPATAPARARHAVATAVGYVGYGVAATRRTSCDRCPPRDAQHRGTGREPQMRETQAKLARLF